MAHIQTNYSKLWKPQDLAVDKISSQKMFVDNIDILEDFAKVTMQKVHAPVRTLDELRAIDTSDTVLFTTGMLIMVQDNGMYSFDRTSTANDNNAVIAPTTGGGRWITTTQSDIAISPKRVTTLEELDTLFTNTLLQMPDKSFKFMVIDGLDNYEPLWGGAGHVMLHKDTNVCATATMITYRTDSTAKQYTKAMFNSVWGRWVRLPYLDENGKIPLNQLPSSVLPASVE